MTMTVDTNSLFKVIKPPYEEMEMRSLSLHSVAIATLHSRVSEFKSLYTIADCPNLISIICSNILH